MGHTNVHNFAIVVTKLQINRLVLAEWMMCSLKWSDLIVSYGTECTAWTIVIKIDEKTCVHKYYFIFIIKIGQAKLWFCYQ